MNIEFPFKEPDFLEAWEEWLTYRKQRKLPKYVEAGLKKTFAYLKNISGDNKDTAIRIINYSIQQNYQGLFAPKNQSNGNAGQTGVSRNKRNNGAYQLLSNLKKDIADRDAKVI